MQRISLTNRNNIALLRHNNITISLLSFFIFFFNDTATTEIYTLSLHDALPISMRRSGSMRESMHVTRATPACAMPSKDRKSTRLNSSHMSISYAVFCLKKKKKKKRKNYLKEV